MKKLLTIFCFTLLLLSNLNSQSLTKISGLAYYDYYYNLKNNDITKRDQQGFQFRRVFLTFDFDVTNKLSARLRIEPEYQGIKDNNKQFLFLKDMFFQYKFDQFQLFAGLMPTPNFEAEERYWGYRSVEKTQSDLRNWITIRDLGLSIKGKAGESLNYAVMIGNNSFHGTETDKYKKLYFHLFNSFGNNIGASFDFNFANGPQNKNVLYSKFGLYRSTNSYSGGLTFVYGLRQKYLSNNESLNELGLSVFGNYKLSDSWKTFLRFDYYEPNTKNSLDQEFTLIGGIDYMLDKNLNIIPNFIYNDYENRNFQDDLTFRLTFHYQF
ncbi:MAG: porin [Ignavibacteria bacterium]